jgi:signal transduction histidine kinase
MSKLAVFSKTPLSEFLSSILENVANRLQVHRASLMLIDHDTNELTMDVAIGFEDKSISDVRIPIGQGISGRVAESGEALWSEDMENDPRFEKKGHGGYTNSSFICMPLITDDVVVGVLNANNKKNDQPFTQDDKEILEILASQAALSIENAKLFEQTRQMQEYISNALNCLKNGIVIINNDNRVTLCTKTAENILDIKAENIINHDFQNRFPPEIVDLFIYLINEAKKNGQITDHEFEITKDVHEPPSPLGFSTSFLMNAEGKNIGTIISIRDLSETREIIKLRYIDQMKNDFLSTVSHELRTPLTSIKGSIALVQQGITGEVNEKQAKMLDIVMRNTDRLTRLINDILDINMEIRKNPLDLAQVLAESLKAFDTMAEKQKINLQIEIDGIDHFIYADQDRIEQVIVNIAGNAFKFTPEDGKITARLSDEGSKITVSISDTGPGIPKDEMEKVFEKFHQVDNSATRGVGGSGLGLAICKKLIEIHNGELWLESEVGKGSTFMFSLPKYKGEKKS